MRKGIMVYAACVAVSELGRRMGSSEHTAKI